MRIKTTNGLMHHLKWWDFTSEHHRLLLEMARLCPNQAVETTHGQMIPVYQLDLNINVLRELNPGR